MIYLGTAGKNRENQDFHTLMRIRNMRATYLLLFFIYLFIFYKLLDSVSSCITRASFVTGKLSLTLSKPSY